LPDCLTTYSVNSADSCFFCETLLHNTVYCFHFSGFQDFVSALPADATTIQQPHLPACSPHCGLRTSAPQPAIPCTDTHLDSVRGNPIIIWIKSHTLTLTNHLPLLSETHLDHPSGSPCHLLFNKPGLNSSAVVSASACGPFCELARH